MTIHHSDLAEVFMPGEFIGDELEARGWKPSTLARFMGCSEQVVEELITGKRTITAETARQLAKSFGTSAQIWLNLASHRPPHQRKQP